MNPTEVLDHEVIDRLLEKLYPILGGHIFFQTLSTAVQFDLFSLFKREGPLPLAEISKRLDIQPHPARILLLGCSALGLVQKSGSAYSNSELAERLLVKDAPGNLLAIVRWQHFINYRAMYWFHDVLCANTNVGLKEFDGNEPTLYERLAHAPALETIFQEAMQCISVHVAHALADRVDFSGVRHLVDVGGGNGANAIALARKYPSLHATIFDSPTVCLMAEANIRAAGLKDRLDAVPGDCFTDVFPQDADCFLFAHFLELWSGEQNQTLLEKCYCSLPADGSVIIVGIMQSDDEDGPMAAAMASPYFLTLATGRGMKFSSREQETWLKQAGFSDVERQVLPRDHCAIIGRKVGR